MADQLFKTESARNTNGIFSIEMKNGNKLAKKLQKLEDGGKTAIKHTLSDINSRAPGWVSKGIRQHYGVDTAAIKAAGPKIKRGAAKIRVAGVCVDNISLKFEGNTLTPIHFKMSPKASKGLQNKRQRIPGQVVKFKGAAGDVGMVRLPKPYTVKATIIKGHRMPMKEGTFITTGKGGSTLPFQRTGKGRMPIEAVRTLSVPQMISGKAKETIEDTLGTNIGKRFEHHIQREMG